MLVRCALAKRLGDQVLVRERDHRDPDSGHPAQLGREHPAGVDDDVGLDLAPLRPHPADPPVGHDDLAHARMREHLAAAVAGAIDQRVGQLRRIEVAVGRQV